MYKSDLSVEILETMVIYARSYIDSRSYPWFHKMIKLSIPVSSLCIHVTVCKCMLVMDSSAYILHPGERNFACEVCGRGFRQKAHLQSHILVHTGERTIRCRYCEKLFARTSDLKQHEYQHTKEKVFTCPHCNKVFYKLQNFKKHSKIHSGQKDYPCHQCEKCFFTRYHMKRHLQTCKGTKGHYTLGPEDPEIVALNMDQCGTSCEEIPTPSDPPGHSQRRTKLKGKGKK